MFTFGTFQTTRTEARTANPIIRRRETTDARHQTACKMHHIGTRVVVGHAPHTRDPTPGRIINVNTALCSAQRRPAPSRNAAFRGATQRAELRTHTRPINVGRHVRAGYLASACHRPARRVRRTWEQGRRRGAEMFSLRIGASFHSQQPPTTPTSTGGRGGKVEGPGACNRTAGGWSRQSETAHICHVRNGWDRSRGCF